MKISFIVPCRNNLKYFKWAYDSIRKNQGNHEVYICAADDASTDGTAEHFKLLTFYHPKFSYITNPGPERVGHTILYDRIVRELVKTDVAIIWHADMYLCEGALDEIEKYMFSECKCVCHEREGLIHTDPCCDNGYVPNYKTIVSLTRIEPPLHPPGPEKIILDCGTEPEKFNEEELLDAVGHFTGYPDLCLPKDIPQSRTTTGIFAPWAFFVKDFLEIGGHDPLYRPQSKEDSDIFNRFKLNGCTFIQTWQGFVYHMTCRGSRFNPTLTTPGKNSDEWTKHNEKSTRNFVRKWGSYVNHDKYMDPIIPDKYETTIILKNCTKQILALCEPFCDVISTDLSKEMIDQYISDEQKNTDFDLNKKFTDFYSSKTQPNISIELDCSLMEYNTIYSLLTQIPYIISNYPIGVYAHVGATITIVHKNPRTNELINLNSEYYKNKLLCV